MADNNRIQVPGKGPNDTEQPLKIGMANADGLVHMMFDPPCVRLRLKPREARSLAIALWGHADSAENPPPIIVAPGE